MNKIEDLSFSGITDELQGDKEAASVMLLTIASETEEVENSIDELKKDLFAKETRKKQLHLGSKHVIAHLKMELPMMVSRKEFAVIVSEKAISIERNVI